MDLLDLSLTDQTSELFVLLQTVPLELTMVEPSLSSNPTDPPNSQGLAIHTHKGCYPHRQIEAGLCLAICQFVGRILGIQSEPALYQGHTIPGKSKWNFKVWICIRDYITITIISYLFNYVTVTISYSS